MLQNYHSPFHPLFPNNFFILFFLEGMSEGEGVECPLCGVRYPLSVIERHAATCDGVPQVSQPPKVRAVAAVSPESQDPDFLLALKLQAEMDAEAERERSASYVCGLCNKSVPLDQLYILDVCTFVHTLRALCSSHFVLYRNALTVSASHASRNTLPKRLPQA